MKTAEDVAQEILTSAENGCFDVKKVESILTTWKEDICKKQRVSNEETKDTIQFILNNPDKDNYVNNNFKHFMRNGEADDDSMELARYWDEQFESVISFLKSVCEPT